MKSSQPYQPLLLRILHGVTGILLTAAILTAFWTYNTYDGRWGRISLPDYKEIEGIHGTFGVFTLLIFPVFALYAFHQGKRRLIQADSLAQLTQIGQPIWWYTLNRITNTLSILALTFALFSGKMMNETWLPKGELNHAWYYAHLVSWLMMFLCVALHVLINAKIGGKALLLSMWNWKFVRQDSPALWSDHISKWRSEFQLSQFTNQLKSKGILGALEITIISSLIAAWIISLLPKD
jgi:hypothetical protein